jgi:hypothetical protein
LARFERQEATDDRLADTLGAATEQLRAALEREAVEIVSKAREQAASIEEAARQSAAEVEQQARAKNAEAEEASARAEEARASQTDRIARLLEDVDAVEERMQAMFGDLRRRLSGELEDIQGPSQHHDPIADPEPPASNGAGEASTGAEPLARPNPPGTDQAMAFSRPVPLSVATEVDAATERNPVLDDMMRAQIVNAAESGTTRADAERFLGRFKLGESYLGMLDEIYSAQNEARTPAGNRNRRRRFRRRGT